MLCTAWSWKPVAHYKGFLLVYLFILSTIKCQGYADKSSWRQELLHTPPLTVSAYRQWPQQGDQGKMFSKIYLLLETENTIMLPEPKGACFSPSMLHIKCSYTGECNFLYATSQIQLGNRYSYQKPHSLGCTSLGTDS